MKIITVMLSGKCRSFMHSPCRHCRSMAAAFLPMAESMLYGRMVTYHEAAAMEAALSELMR